MTCTVYCKNLELKVNVLYCKERSRSVNFLVRRVAGIIYGNISLLLGLPAKVAFTIVTYLLVVRTLTLTLTSKEYANEVSARPRRNGKATPRFGLQHGEHVSLHAAQQLVVMTNVPISVHVLHRSRPITLIQPSEPMGPLLFIASILVSQQQHLTIQAYNLYRSDYE